MLQIMNLMLVFALSSILFPTFTQAIRCYKCDATNECKTISNDASLRNHHYLSDIVEIVDCEYYCWKSVSLGNVYRGCAKKRCTISHSIGPFSSSVCCDTDYCNGSVKILLSKCLIAILVCSTVFFHYFS